MNEKKATKKMSSLPYIQQLTKVIVAQITQTIGWNSIQTTPLELLTDILHKYMEELTRQTQRYTELYGRTEPNLDDIALAFNDLNINAADLEEYITNVDSVPCIINVPKFPIPKESNLNFLKPGSKEVVTRPVHIHEHLPPIQPHEETPPVEEPSVVESRIEDEQNSANIIQTYISTNQISERPIMDANGVFDHETMADGGLDIIAETTVIENHSSAPNDENTFRRPFDVPPSSQSTSNHRPLAPLSSATNNNENLPNANTIGKPTREIVSCFMTTGGFISPAREGKLPEAKKPIIIEEEPEPIVETKQRTPTPEPIERKHHSNKRENKIETIDTSKNYGNDGQNAIDGAYGDEENGKEVKLYEVIQTVPEPLPKKKTKKSQLDGAATAKEIKKKKKMNQLKAGKLGSIIQNPFSHIALTGGGPMDRDRINEPVDSNLLVANEKAKKKKEKLEMLKKKRKQKQLAAAQMSFATGNDPLAVGTEKPRKKKMSKLSKKNLQAMGLNPNAIEGFAIPSTPTDPYAMPDAMMGEKESLKKIKQRQKLSNSPDKQKIKFFKKLSSTSSNLMSKPNEDPHELDRMMNPMLPHSMTTPNELNHHHQQHHHHMPGHPLNPADSYDGVAQFGHMPGMADLNRTPINLIDDGMPPSKKSKLLKKLNKPPKEPKPPKIKKEKKDPLAKKERVPKTPKFLDPQIGMPKPMLNHPDENPMPKMFLNDEFRPNPMNSNSNVGMIDQFAMSGLNPLNPLFQSVRFDFPAARNQNYPFASGLPNFDFANLSRFKRPNFNDPKQNEIENMPKHPHDMINAPPKPFCNVAPLMPPSLLNLESHHKDEYMPSSSMNEPHTSQKHYPDNVPNTSFGSKKTVMFNNPNSSFADQSFAIDNDSPIVINSDDDDDDDDHKHRNSSQSPSLDQDPSFSGGEMKRKKVKDKKDKEKKEKKDKDTGVVKLKKKKDKKDKSKNKGEHSKSPKDKSALKKEKREKKKERERSAAALSLDTSDGIGTPSNSYYSSSQVHSEWPRDAFTKQHDHGQIGDSSDINAPFNTDNSNMEISTVPKLTLKLPPSSTSPSSRTSRPTTPDFPINKKSSKKKKRQWRTMEGDSDKSDADEGAGVGTSGKIDEANEKMTREPSPELARISALITRPPKQKSSKQQQAADFTSPIRNDFFDGSASNRSDYHSSIASSTPMPATPSGRGRPKGSSSLKGSKSKSKASTSFATDSDKKSQTFDNQSIIDTQSVQNVVQSVNEQANDENQVWICPACGLVDDGTPMIGCDGCDDWYHWVCVGILVPPSDDQDWFCRMCISRKQEDKKKKRKKKDKKDH